MQAEETEKAQGVLVGSEEGQHAVHGETPPRQEKAEEDASLQDERGRESAEEAADAGHVANPTEIKVAETQQRAQPQNAAEYETSMEGTTEGTNAGDGEIYSRSAAATSQGERGAPEWEKNQSYETARAEADSADPPAQAPQQQTKDEETKVSYAEEHLIEQMKAAVDVQTSCSHILRVDVSQIRACMDVKGYRENTNRTTLADMVV